MPQFSLRQGFTGDPLKRDGRGFLSKLNHDLLIPIHVFITIIVRYSVVTCTKINYYLSEITNNWSHFTANNISAYIYAKAHTAVRTYEISCVICRAAVTDCTRYKYRINRLVRFEFFRSYLRRVFSSRDAGEEEERAASEAAGGGRQDA